MDSVGQPGYVDFYSIEKAGWTPCVYTLYQRNPSQNWYQYNGADDGSVSIANLAPTANFLDDSTHKYRQFWDRTAETSEIFCDGVPQGVANMHAIAAKAISAWNLDFGGLSWGCKINIYEWRLNLNATNNSGGPGGG